MKRFLALALIVVMGMGSTNAQTAFNIAVHLDNEQNSDVFKQIASLSSGDFVTTGLYVDSDTPIGGDSVFLAKFNQFGELLWQNKIAYLPENLTSAGHSAKGFTLIEDSLIAVLEFIQSSLIQPEFEYWLWDSFVHLFNSNGNFMQTLEPQASFYAYSFEYLKYTNNRIILLGSGISNSNISGNYDWLMVSMDLEGNTLKELTIHDPSQLNEAAGILELSDGKIILATRNKNENNSYTSFQLHCISADLEEILWSETYEGAIMYSLAEGIDGKILVGGYLLNQWPYEDSRVRTLYIIDPENGNDEWIEPYYDSLIDKSFIYGIHQKANGSIYLGGYVKEKETNNRNAYLMKINPDFSVEWEKRYKCFEQQQEEYIRDMVATPDGGFLLGGWSRGIDEEQEEIWLIKTDSLGNDSIPIGVYFVQDTLFLNHGETYQMNPIPYGGSNSYTHQWTGGTVYLDETQTWYPTFTGSQAGTFMLTYTATDAVDGNEATAEIVVVVYPADALTELNPNNWQVYPNPAIDQIQINTDYQGEVLLKIYAMDGRLLRQASIQGNQTINLQALPSGLLSLQVYADNGQLLHKVKVLKR